ncbi:MAG: PEP-CTERM sorting domain-containing protein [Pseudomonadota bacterium]
MKTLAPLLLALALTSQAHAAGIGFDDITGPGVPAIADGYAGLDWTNMYSADSSTYPYDSGFIWGNVSADRVAFSGPLGSSGFASATDFTFDSVHLTGAWRDDLNVLVEGYDDGVLMHSVNLVVDLYAPTWFSFGWSSIDSVIFTTSGGVNAGLRSNGPQLVLDDLLLTPVPEAETWAMLLVGLGVVALQLRNRKLVLAA